MVDKSRDVDRFEKMMGSRDKNQSRASQKSL